MPILTDKAIQNHQSGNSCSASVLKAFASSAGMTESEAVKAAMPFAGGRMIKCGAVLAAEYVLNKTGGSNGEKLADEFESRFIEMNGSAVCRELKGVGTGKILRSCRGCVTDAAEILEEMLMRQNG